MKEVGERIIDVEPEKVQTYDNGNDIVLIGGYSNRLGNRSDTPAIPVRVRVSQQIKNNGSLTY